MEVGESQEMEGSATVWLKPDWSGLMLGLWNFWSAGGTIVLEAGRVVVLACVLDYQSGIGGKMNWTRVRKGANLEVNIVGPELRC